MVGVGFARPQWAGATAIRATNTDVVSQPALPAVDAPAPAQGTLRAEPRRRRHRHAHPLIVRTGPWPDCALCRSAGFESPGLHAVPGRPQAARGRRCGQAPAMAPTCWRRSGTRRGPPTPPGSEDWHRRLVRAAEDDRAPAPGHRAGCCCVWSPELAPLSPRECWPRWGGLSSRRLRTFGGPLRVRSSALRPSRPAQRSSVERTRPGGCPCSTPRLSLRPLRSLG